MKQLLPTIFFFVFLSSGFAEAANETTESSNSHGEPVNVAPSDIILTASPISEDAPVGTIIGTFSTVDPDAGDTHTYEIIGDANIPSITVDGNNLVVEGQLDAEGQNPFNFNVITTDAGGLTYQKLVSFDILDVNEAPTDIAFKVGGNSFTLSASFTTTENNAIGQNLRRLLTFDQDAGDTHTYSLSGEDAASFSLGTDPLLPGEILLKAETIFDYEAGDTLHFNIVSEDASGASLSKAYVMTVVDDNDVPTDILISGGEETDTIYVDELNAIGDALATFLTVDQDTFDTHQYEFINTFAADPIFSLDGDVLQADIVFDHEATEFYEVGIRTLDSEFEQTTKVFVVAVNDINEAPTDLFFVGANPSFRANIEENNAVGDLIATIGVSDPDAGDTFTFEITGNGVEDFTVDGNQIRAARIFDHESEERTTYTLAITVTDSEGLSYFELFNINIIDVQEFGSNQEVAAFDFTGQSFRDSINGYTAEATQFNQNTGELLYPTPTTDRFGEVDNALQFSPSRSIVMNEPILNLTESFSLNLWFRMDATIPTSGQFLLQHPSISVGIDNQGTLFLQGYNGNTQVFNFSTPSTLATEQWYMLTIVADFQSNSDAVMLYINDAVSNNITQQSINIPTNGGWYFGSTGSSQFPFSGKIDDITYYQKALSGSEVSQLYSNSTGNVAPTAILLDANAVDENQPIGTLVGELSTTDPDQGDTHTYSLSGTDAASFSINGNNLETAEVFDFEAKPSYSIEVTTTDIGGATFSDSFTITVNDLAENNAPTDISLSSETILENESVRTLVGLLSTADSDNGDSHSYSLSGPDASSFTIGVPASSETQTLGLLSNAVFDFEAKSSYSIEITTDDGNGGTFTKSFIIAIQDENEAPTQIDLSNNTIRENEEVGSFVGSFSTFDPDAGDSHTISIAGADAGSFSLTLESNAARTERTNQALIYVLRSNEAFDFESRSSYIIDVTSTDAGNLSITTTFTINIEDVTNESNAPTDILLSNVTVDENQPVGTLIGNLSTIDPDAGDTHTYTLGGDQGSSFQLDGSNVLTAEVFDASIRTTYEIEITADDGNGGVFTKPFIITVQAEETTVLSVGNEIKVDYYPNPVTEQLILKGSSTTTYKLVSISGSVLRSNSIKNGQVSLDLRNIPTGSYLLILQDGDSKQTEMIIKR